MRASRRRVIKKLKAAYDDSLLKLDRIPDIEKINESTTVSEDDPEAWNIQVPQKYTINSFYSVSGAELNAYCRFSALLIPTPSKASLRIPEWLQDW